MSLAFPSIDPVAIQIGPLAVRWYALAYLAGVGLGWLYARYLAKRAKDGPAPRYYSDAISWIVVGMLLGGRLGYILFYNAIHYMHHPLEALMLWRGGMSFHGGALGVIVACWLFCKIRRIPYLAFMDPIACAAPIGLFFGRIANFINGELFGRTTGASWGMIFPHGGDLPRHPSQLYEAGLEGLGLCIILGIFAHMNSFRERAGFLSGAFLAFYAAFRAFVENFREPDAQLGYLWGGLTMGQILCIPMGILGLYLMRRAFRKSAAA